VADAPLQPVNLAMDAAGNLLVVSYADAGTVYAQRPALGADVVRLTPEPATTRPDATFYVPVGDWRLQRQPDGTLAPRSHHYLSPDGGTVLSATAGFVEGATSWGVKASDLIRTFGLQGARAGQRVYLTSEAELATWSARVTEQGGFDDLRPFVEQGGEGLAVDEDGHVYIAAGDVFVYDAAGSLVETIAVPERPTQLLFGGSDRRTLFMPARRSLYAVRTRVAGRR
jgi:hypothetical protein